MYAHLQCVVGLPFFTTEFMSRGTVPSSGVSGGPTTTTWRRDQLIPEKNTGQPKSKQQNGVVYNVGVSGVEIERERGRECL